MLSKILTSLTLATLGLVTAYGQSPRQLPGCESNPQVKKALAEAAKQRPLLPFAESLAKHKQTIESLLMKYPHDLDVHVARINTGRYEDFENWPALRESYVRESERHPDDAMAVALAGVVLFRKDTPETIRRLEQAGKMAPNWGFPPQQLASVYASGKYADKQKMAENIVRYFELCPESTDPISHMFLGKAGRNDLQAQFASKLRQRLVQQKGVDDFRIYDQLLWPYEFRSRPVGEHPAVRQQVAEDLKRLETLKKQPDAEWLMFLRGGYKQSGASPATITGLEDRLLREFPSSQEAYQIESERWNLQNKPPDDHKDQEAWRKYNASQLAALQKWMRQFPTIHYLKNQYFYAARSQERGSERADTELVDAYLDSAKYSMPYSGPRVAAAEFLLERGWQPARALTLLKEAEPMMLKESQMFRENDSVSDDEKKSAEKYLPQQRQRWVRLILNASRKTQEPAVAQSLKTEIEGALPSEKEQQSAYWWNRAALAAAESRKADALTYYQTALLTRTQEARYIQGRRKDELGDEAHALFSELGGTETAWTVWSQRPQAAKQELSEGRWEAAKKELPRFDLKDMQGKSWRLQELGGKSLLINLWATWCGPCKAELPKLQQLYTQIKERKDVQVLSFNIDGEVGLVEPYLKEHGYSFPVIPAYDFVNASLDVMGIPQNWIVDPAGKWRWTQLGFDGSEPNWTETMLKRMESVQAQR